MVGGRGQALPSPTVAGSRLSPMCPGFLVVLEKPNRSSFTISQPCFPRLLPCVAALLAVATQAERKAKEAKKRHEVVLKTCKDLRAQLAQSHAAIAHEVCSPACMSAPVCVAISHIPQYFPRVSVGTRLCVRWRGWLLPSEPSRATSLDIPSCPRWPSSSCHHRPPLSCTRIARNTYPRPNAPPPSTHRRTP